MGVGKKILDSCGGVNWESAWQVRRVAVGKGGVRKVKRYYDVSLKDCVKSFNRGLQSPGGTRFQIVIRIIESYF